MKAPLFFQALATAALTLAATGQGTTPRSENEFLKTMDSIGAGGPARKPLTLEGTNLDPKKAPKTEKKAKGQTEITSLELTFDNKTREAVFIGDVVVKDPEFNVVCDRLIALLKKQAEDGEKGPGAAAPAAKPPPAADPPPGATSSKDDKAKQKGGGLDKATAEANPGKTVEITQDKLEADGTITKNIGISRKATYDAKTGDIVLIGSPSVQTGINLCVATSDGTIMILNRNGQMSVKGPSKTVIKDATAADAR